MTFMGRAIALCLFVHAGSALAQAPSPATTGSETADPAVAPPPAETEAACFPACRSGFLCHQGQCVSSCNPPCDAGTTCTAAGECVVESGATAAPAAAVAAPPPVQAPPEPTPSAPARDPRADPMDSFGFTLKLGLTGHGKRDITFDGEDGGSFDGNQGFMFGFGLNLLDGHGFGIDLNMSVRRYRDSYSDSFASYDFTYGTFAFEPAFGARFQLARPLYMFVGIGPRVGVEWWEDVDETGLVAGFRIPIQVNFYVNTFLAIVGEVGVGYDAVTYFFDDAFGTFTQVDRGPIFDVTAGVRFR